MAFSGHQIERWWQASILTRHGKAPLRKRATEWLSEPGREWGIVPQGAGRISIPLISGFSILGVNVMSSLPSVTSTRDGFDVGAVGAAGLDPDIKILEFLAFDIE